KGARSFARLLVFFLSLLALAAPSFANDFSAGMPLTDALLALEKGGIKLVFSSQLVRPEMTVRSAPVSRDPRAILDEILAPNGLSVEEGPSGILVGISSPRSPGSSS